MSDKKVKITKHQMKEDKLVTIAFRFTEFIQKRSKEFLIAGAAVVVVVLIVLFLISSNRSRNQKAAELLGKARVELESGEFQNGLADLQDVLRRYGGTKAAAEARYLLANSYYYSRDYDQALRYFQDFIKKYSKADPMVLSGALAGVADCYMQKGVFEPAAEYYLKAAEKSSDEFSAPDYLLSAAQAYKQANQPDKAKELYERIIQKYPAAKNVSSVRMELAELSKTQEKK